MNVPLARGAVFTGVIPLLEEMGLDVAAIVAEVGVPREAYGDANARVPSAAGAKLSAAIARRGVTCFGLELGSRRELSNWGVLAEIVSSQATLRGIIGKVVDFIPVQIEGLRLLLIEGEPTSELHLNLFYEVAAGALAQLVEGQLAILHRSLTEATAGEWRPLAVCFRHKRNAPAELYARVFGVDALFDQGFDGFLIATADLSIENPRRSRTVDGLAEDVARAHIRPRSLAEKVVELAVLLLPDGRATAEEFSRVLGVPLRSLQRGLAAEGVSLSALVEEARVRLARAVVETSSRPFLEVALQLGFDSQAGFSRWHKIQFGMTPSARRRAAQK